jgi:ATP-grasp ribosomal peptide maturase
MTDHHTNGRAVLLVSHPKDSTAELVADALRKRGDVRVVWFDVADFPLSLTCRAVGPPWRTVLDTRGGSVRLDHVSGVLYRRPTQYVFPDAMSDTNRRFAAGEARVGLGGLLAGLPCRWVNHPARVADAEFKPVQLQAAHELGLTVPRTLITNDPTAAAGFAREAGPVVYKTLHGLDVQSSDGAAAGVVYTTPVTANQLDDPSLRLTAHLIQQQITKQYELRVTVVAGRCFTARVDTTSEAAGRDFRSDYDHTTFHPAEVPADVAGKLVAYLDRFGLAFGAFDLVVDPAGDVYFLECNPNGQWGWIEEDTGLPIADAIADYLAGE